MLTERLNVGELRCVLAESRGIIVFFLHDKERFWKQGYVIRSGDVFVVTRVLNDDLYCFTPEVAILTKAGVGLAYLLDVTQESDEKVLSR